MTATKTAGLGMGGIPTPEQLEKINLQTKSPLQAEQVYCFTVRLCDDRPDRDNERFATEALPRLAELFIGKTGICDHTWSALGQVARIFDTRVEQEGEATVLRAQAYMLRSDKTRDLIDSIEAGIHREVSVGCAMGKTLCSVCGKEYGTCAHHKGEHYGNEICYGILCDPVDAYEFSFVAVPAQPAAGVTKQFSRLGEDCIRLALGLGLPVERSVLETVAKALDEDTLFRLHTALKGLFDEKYPGSVQLVGKQDAPKSFGAEYLI